MTDGHGPTGQQMQAARQHERINFLEAENRRLEQEAGELSVKVAVRNTMLANLVAGVKWWADQEDGVPDDVWDAYASARELLTGKRPIPKDA